jgi:hypothetical protein
LVDTEEHQLQVMPLSDLLSTSTGAWLLHNWEGFGIENPFNTKLGEQQLKEAKQYFTAHLKDALESDPAKRKKWVAVANNSIVAEGNDYESVNKIVLQNPTLLVPHYVCVGRKIKPINIFLR